MIGAKSSMSLDNVKLSILLGGLEYRKVGKPYTNPKTAEVTTKLTVLSDKYDDMYEVTCIGEIEEGVYKKGQEIDFDNCVVRFSASGAKGFNQGDVNGILNISIRATEIIDLREKTMFSNEQVENKPKEENKNVKK